MSRLSDVPEVAAVVAHFTATRQPFLLLVVGVNESGQPTLRHVGTTPPASGADAEEYLRELAAWYLRTCDGWTATRPAGGGSP